MRTIEIEWVEQVRYRQRFEVEDDFVPDDPDDFGQPLEDLIIDEGDLDAAFAGVEERDVESWKWADDDG